jgi:hypothetical protein
LVCRVVACLVDLSLLGLWKETRENNKPSTR